jgi:hypothetical protein
MPYSRQSKIHTLRRAEDCVIDVEAPAKREPSAVAHLARDHGTKAIE